MATVKYETKKPRGKSVELTVHVPLKALKNFRKILNENADQEIGTSEKEMMEALITQLENDLREGLESYGYMVADSEGTFD